MKRDTLQGLPSVRSACNYCEKCRKLRWSHDGHPFLLLLLLSLVLVLLTIFICFMDCSFRGWILLYCGGTRRVSVSLLFLLLFLLPMHCAFIFSLGFFFYSILYWLQAAEHWGKKYLVTLALSKGTGFGIISLFVHIFK